MTTLEKMTADLTAAMKARDTFAVATLRQVIGAVRTAEKSGRAAATFTDEQVWAVLAAEVKKRRESAQIYAGVGASDRSATETTEADFIERYLPEVVSDEQLSALVDAAIAATGALTVKDMGRVMKAVTAAAADLGRVDGKALAALVKGALTA